MVNIIGNEQTCGIKGRSLHQNLSLIRDTFLYIQDRKLPLCVVGLDLEKAFDSLDHLFYVKCYRVMDLASQFLDGSIYYTLDVRVAYW